MRPDLHNRKLTDAQVASMARSYQSGHSVTEIKTVFGVSHSTVYDALRRFGVAFRYAGRPGKRKFGLRGTERVNQMLAEESAWQRDQERIAKTRAGVAPKTHGECAVCHKQIARGESYTDSGTGRRHMRDCLHQTLEQGRRYSFIREIGRGVGTVDL